MNVLDDDDRVVHENADRKDECEERDPVQSEPPGPAGEERGRQRQDDRAADDDCFSLAQGKANQQNHRSGCKRELLNELVGFFSGSFTVVPRNRHFDVGGDQCVAQRFHSSTGSRRDVHGVFAGLLGDCDCDGRVDLSGFLTTFPISTCCPGGKPDIALRQLRASFNAGDFAQIDRFALADADDQVTDIRCGSQEFTGLDNKHLACVAGALQHCARRHTEVRGRQRVLQAQQVDAALAQATGIEPHMNRATRSAYGLHLTGAWNRLDFLFNVAGDLFKFHARHRLLAPERDGQNRDIVDSLGLHDGRQCAKLPWQPVLIGIEHVVQADQGLRACNPDFELNRQDCDTRSGD